VVVRRLRESRRAQLEMGSLGCTRSAGGVASDGGEVRRWNVLFGVSVEDKER
jgi:hypothetical protein